MGAWIGTLGRLVELEGVSAQQIEYWDGRTFQRTLEGRVVVQAKAKRNREWRISVGVGTPAALANIQALQDGEYGRGPFVFVPPLAQVTNMLMPDVSTCGPTAVVGSAASMAGPLRLPDGSWAGRSLSNPAPSPTLWFGQNTTPVIPGSKVTASAYVVGAGSKVGVQFRNGAGDAVGQSVSPQSGIAGVVTRLAVTATVPATAVSCVVYATDATLAARPAITWTDELFDWGIGAGCTKAIPHGFSTDLILALREKNYGRYSSIGFNVTEVG